MLYLWWAKWHWDRFFFPHYLGIPLSVSFRQCSILIYMSLLAESQTGEGWEPSHKQRSSVNRGATDRRELSLFFSLASQAPSSCLEVKAAMPTRVPLFIHLKSTQSAPAGAQPSPNIWMSQCETLYYCMRYSTLYGRPVLLIRAGKETRLTLFPFICYLFIYSFCNPLSTAGCVTLDLPFEGWRR
jgi:hypothetical protein